MYELEYVLPHSKKKEKTILKMNREQQLLFNIVQKIKGSALRKSGGTNFFS